MRTVRIGNGAGFWGDNLDAPRLLAEAGRLDYLTLEYLAELTMSILAHQRSRDVETGYVGDFPTVVESLLPTLRSQPELRIVTNAGGMNPAGCARRVAEILAVGDLADMRIAAVSGDDLTAAIDEHLAAGEVFSHLETGQPLGDLRERVVSANAYLGAAGIVEALANDARVVITGRVADASLVLGPALHEFGWDQNDWQRLAGATVAGHLVECGAQLTGGMNSTWTSETPLANLGYPIAELSEDGTAIVTKADETDGRVTCETVSEQLIYEIGDPAHYLTPDVDADFSQVALEEVGPDRVRVSGAQGNPAPERLKVSLAYSDGWKASGMLVVAGRDCAAKAKIAGQMLLDRVQRAGFKLDRTLVECLGAGDSMPGIALGTGDPWEVVLRVSAFDSRRVAVERFCREFAPLVTSGPPGVTGYTGARARAQRVLAYWPTTIARGAVTPHVTVKTATEWTT
jgi:hypothetical protein